MTHQILRYEHVSSTQALAKALLSAGIGEGTVVLADRQEQGRGRHGNHWISPLGGMYASLIVHNQPLLPLRTGIALTEALRKIGVNASLKWPNDVLVGERKIAGILIEAVEDWAIVGIGVNIAIAPVPGASSVAAETTAHVTPEGLLELILKRFDQSLSERELLEYYRALCETIGHPVRVSIGKDVVKGLAIDIDPQGRLLVEDRGVRYVVASGECRTLRANL